MGLARALLLLALLALLQNTAQATGGHDDDDDGDRQLLQDADAALDVDRPISYKVFEVKKFGHKSEIYAKVANLKFETGKAFLPGVYICLTTG